jgi:hypothetical protein
MYELMYNVNGHSARALGPVLNRMWEVLLEGTVSNDSARPSGETHVFLNKTRGDMTWGQVLIP